MQKIDINQYVDKFFEHKINASRIFNNPKISFFIILNIVLLIGCYNLLNNNAKNAIMTLVSYPIVLISLLAISLFIAYNNLPIGILIIVSLFIVLYPSNNTDDNENSQKIILTI
jgi:CDP-diglyceride synthetase